MIDGIVIDPMRCAETGSAIGAASKHHVGPVARAIRFHTGQHVNVVIRWATGTVHRQKYLPAKTDPVYAALDKAATQVNRRGLIKRGRNATILCIARSRAPETAPGIPAPDKKIAVARHIERAPLHGVGNVN